MATHKFSPLLGKRIRATQMTDAGAIGAHKVTTDGFISVSMSSEIEDGVEIIQRNAWGVLCINERKNPSFKRLNIEIVFCGVNPTLLSYVSNAVEYEDWAGDVAGFTIPEGEIEGAFALEMWTGLSGALNDTNANGYMLLPYVGKGNIGDITLDGENAINFTVTGAMTRGGHDWGVGPYDVVINADSPGVADVLPTPLDPYDHFLLIDTAVPAPTVNEQPVIVP